MSVIEGGVVVFMLEGCLSIGWVDSYVTPVGRGVTGFDISRRTGRHVLPQRLAQKHRNAPQKSIDASLSRIRDS